MYNVSSLRFYDEAVLKYFSDIMVSDGVETRYAQALLATPSRKGVKLQKNNTNNTPILPFISITRTSLLPKADTHLVKGHRTRGARFKSLSSNIKSFDLIETMPYNYSYQADLFSLQQEMFNQMIEQILFKTEKYHYVPVRIEVGNFNILDNAYIGDINYTDSTGYSQISDNNYRIFHGTVTFTVNGHIINDYQGAKSIIHTQNAINADDRIIVGRYDGTIEDLIEKRNKQGINN